MKINIDKNQELVEKMGIESVPTVFLVYKGNVVDSFAGIPDEKRLGEFFDSIKILIGIAEDDTIIRSLLKGADEWLHKKQWDQAENMFNEALSYEKWRNKYGSIIKLGLSKYFLIFLAYCAYHKNDFDLTEKIIKEIYVKYEKDVKNDEDLKKRISNLEIKLLTKKNPSLLASIYFKIKKENLENLEIEIEKNPKDLDNRYHLALQYFEHSDFEKSISTLIEIIKIDRNWNNKIAHDFLLKIFNFLGSASKLTIDGRKNLSKVLF